MARGCLAMYRAWSNDRAKTSAPPLMPNQRIVCIFTLLSALLPHVHLLLAPRANRHFVLHFAYPVDPSGHGRRVVGVLLAWHLATEGDDPVDRGHFEVEIDRERV